MNLAWILLLAQVAVPNWHILCTPSTHDCDDPNGYIFTPADPPQHELRVWKDTDGVYHAINWIGQEIRSDAKPPKPEPMDVPAVEPKCPQTMNGWVSSKCQWLEDMNWTCADKSRVLLTSEDGKKHCIKFPGE